MTTSLPTLYKKTSNGAGQVWNIHTEDNVIVTAYGLVDGKKQVNRELIADGKNIGKANETTPTQQAVAEAKSRWEKKAKKGYVQDLAGALAGERDAQFVAGGIDPMLAHKYKEQGKKITYPAYVQPKLDGHRCVAVVGDAGVVLYSRSRKVIRGVPHVSRAIEAMSLPVGTILDGELYNHDYHDKFEELTSFIRQVTPKPGHEVVQYHVYDLPSSTGSFRNRLYWLRCWITEDPAVRLVETEAVYNFDEVQSFFANYLADGYEGAMVRNADSLYKFGRSYDLQKVKEFDDAEFTIVGIESGRGRMEGRAIFTCTTDSGDTFAAKMKGTIDSLAYYLDHKDEFIGQLLTVQYQGLSAKGIPRFPVGLRIRKDA
jgi:DNA ligase-1